MRAMVLLRGGESLRIGISVIMLRLSVLVCVLRSLFVFAQRSEFMQTMSDARLLRETENHRWVGKPC